MSNTPLNSLGIFESQIAKNERELAKYHIHKWEREGASNCLGCNYLRVLKKLGIELPELSEFKAKVKQIFALGHLIHGDIQQGLHEAFDHHPDIQYEDEVLIECAVPNTNLIFESPMDNVFFKREEGNYELVTDQLLMKDLKIKKITPKGIKNLIQIGDIKSESDYAFADAMEGKFGPNNLGQFHIYMAATGLKEMEILGIRKSDNEKVRQIVKWDDGIWNMVITHNRAYILLCNLYMNLKADHPSELPLSDPMNYACLNPDLIDWWGCPLSITQVYEKKYPKYKQSQEIFRPCDHAVKYIEKLIPHRFQVGKVLTRKQANSPKTQVTITKIEGSTIECQNVTKTGKGKTYIDEKIWAWFHYTENDGGEE